MMNRPYILIVEDEFLVALAWREELIDEGFRVSTAHQAAAALAILRREPVSAMITDIGLPDMSGDELAVQSRAEFPSLPIILVTGFDVHRPTLLAACPRTRVLQKPVESHILVECLRMLL